MYILKQTYLLLIIVAFAILLRFVQLNQVPPSINWDEASIGYNAYSILKTGKDEWGRFLPFTFEAFGDYKLPGYIYVLIPFIKLFDLNEFSVRLPSQIAGIIAVLLLYLIVKTLSNNKTLALFSALFLAISPWHMFLSRIAVEANLALTLFLAALYLFILGRSNTKFLIPSSIFFGATLFTYNSARIFIPLLFLSLVFFRRQQLFKARKQLILPGLILLIAFGAATFLAVLQDSSARYYWVSIVDRGAIDYLNQQRGSSPFPSPVTILVYNKYTYFTINFIVNYLKHFSLEFLFLKGGTNYQFSLPNFGLMYLLELPFFLLGFYSLLKTKSMAWIVLPWLLLAPIPSAITREAPHALRSIFMLGSLQIISASGAIFLLNLLKNYRPGVNRAVIVFSAILFMMNSLFYTYQYFYKYNTVYSEAWQYGYQQAISFIKKGSDQNEKYKNIIITKRYGEPHIFYLFFTKYDPTKYQNNPTLIRYFRTYWRWVDRLDNIQFVDDNRIKEKIDQMGDRKGLLVIASQPNYPSGGKVVSTIDFLDGSRAFDVVEY